jgi:hypothetical protein
MERGEIRHGIAGNLSPSLTEIAVAGGRLLWAE